MDRQGPGQKKSFSFHALGTLKMVALVFDFLP